MRGVSIVVFVSMLFGFAQAQSGMQFLNEYLDFSGLSQHQVNSDSLIFNAENSTKIVSGIPSYKLTDAPSIDQLHDLSGNSVSVEQAHRLNPLLVNVPRENKYFAPRYVLDKDAGEVLIFISEHQLAIQYQSHQLKAKQNGQ
jgi:hypothetical protein